MFASCDGGKVANSTEETDDRSRDGSHDQQHDHHRHGAVLVFVIERRPDEAVSGDGFHETVGFLKLRRFSPWNAFSLANFATHDSAEGVGGHSPCEPCIRRKPHSPMAQALWHGAIQFRGQRRAYSSRR